jgi:hypothetical protein
MLDRLSVYPLCVPEDESFLGAILLWWWNALSAAALAKRLLHLLFYLIGYRCHKC